MFQIASQVEGPGPTQVTCPACGVVSDWADRQNTMHGACCSDSCATSFAFRPPQMPLFTDGEVPYAITDEYTPISVLLDVDVRGHEPGAGSMSLFD